MFNTLKNKIKEETGKEVTPLPVRMGSQSRLQRSQFGSTVSIEGMSYTLEQKDLEIAGLRLQCTDLSAQVDELTKQVEQLKSGNERIEQSNQLLEESVKVAQFQKELILDEQNQIQNFQSQEISKLKSLLNFREQEAVDQMAVIKQHQQQLDLLKAENKHLRDAESQREDIQQQSEDETTELRQRLDVANERINEYIEQADAMSKTLHSQTADLKEEIIRLNASLEAESAAHRSTALKNAEISQEIAKLKQDLNAERAEAAEVTENLHQLQYRLDEKVSEVEELQRKNEELSTIVSGQSDEQTNLEELNKEMAEKNKEIKVLKQRLADFKKTLQQELKSSSTDPNRSAMIDIDITHCATSAASATQPTSVTMNGNSSTTTPVVLDEVNFMYLKHVILKFLTSREVEARHLIKAVGMLLHLSQDEEKLLHDTLNYKTSWFGARNELSFI